MESFDASPDEEDYDDDDYEIAQRRSSNDEDGFQCYRCNLWYPTKDEMNDCIQSCIEYNDRIYDAESFESEWDFGDDRESLREGDEHSDFNNAWRWIFKTKRREWPKWGQKFYDKYKWTLDDPHWNPQFDAESFDAEDWEVCPKNRDFGDAERGHDWLEVLVCAACGKEDYSKNAESFEAEGVPEGFHRMPDGTIMADSAHGAESFDADGIYQMCKMCGDKADALIDSPIYGMVCRECFEPDAGYYGAEESFDAQTKITGYTRGKDWEGKPYTGQIFPDHSDLDHELADRNQDGKMASWERAIGNQVARGKSRFKAPRKMLNPRLPQMKSSTTHSSILPYALAVGALATIMGLRNMGGSNE